MVMKKAFVFLILSLFLISVVPIGVLADEDRSGSDSGSDETDDNSGSDDSSDNDDSSDSSDDNSGDDDVEEGIRKVRRLVKEKAGEFEERTEIKEKIKSAGLEVERRLDIRTRQREHFEAAIDKCKDAEDAEKCEEKLKERLELVGKLEEKGAERLEKIQEKRAKMVRKLDELKEREHFTKFKLENAKARLVAKEKLENAEKRFKEVREEFKESHKKKQDSRKSFIEARERWRTECSSNEDGEECQELDSRLKTHVSGYLLHTVDSVLHELEKIQSKIEGSDDLTEDEAAEVLADVQAKIAEAEAVKAKVKALNLENTREEIDAVAREVRNLWNDVKQNLKQHAARVVNARMGGVLVKSEQMSVKLARVLERMAEKGVDTTTVEELVDSFNAHLDEAKTAYEEAQDLFNEAAKLEGEAKGEGIKEAQESMKTAKESLNEAHKVLKEIQEQLKEQRHLDTLEEVEVEEEVEIETE